MRVLLVEDDVRVAAALVCALRRRSYIVTCAADADQALSAPMADLVLLDIGLPGRDGLSVCRELRRRHPEVSIIAVTARGAERDRVAGLRAGADDYVVKPFSMAELQARIDAVLRRAVRGARPVEVLRIGTLQMNPAAHTVAVAGVPVSLTGKEFDILLALARQPGVAVPRPELLLAVWHSDLSGGHSLEVHIAALRSKLGDPGWIRTVRGVGYQLWVP
jgi:DNA-binding response OmpR family regulator